MSEEKTEEVVAEETSSSKENTTQKASESGQGKTLIAIVIVVILIVGALEMTGTTKMFGGATVAVVNGEKISQVDYQSPYYFDCNISHILHYHLNVSSIPS